jgi:hypothetical protein
MPAGTTQLGHSTITQGIELGAEAIQLVWSQNTVGMHGVNNKYTDPSDIGMNLT